MLLLWQFLPAFAAAVVQEDDQYRSQHLRTGVQLELQDAGEAKSESHRSQDTWKALRTNRQKLRELTREKFNENQKENEELQTIQVTILSFQLCTFTLFAGPARRAPRATGRHALGADRR